MPLTLYLKCLGIEIIQPRRFRLRGNNLFPWSVTLRWKGVEIRCYEDHKEVIFPNGEQVRVDGDEEKVVEFLRN